MIGFSYQLLSVRLHVVGVWICVLEGVSALGEELGGVKQVLPVYPGARPAHHLLCDAVFDGIASDGDAFSLLLIKYERHKCQ